ncbi:MAG: hypothetical protein CYPHOPRED_005795 [Cyphobasidiales sp. Tagirdzhanova-0007]|nr:MAG: hypothetical protein CYPHOPRED_005795 [Cyphobasidiales sp. Tagirdzhanova-0007]
MSYSTSSFINFPENRPQPATVYLGNVPVALYGVRPFVRTPISHFVGRRPVMLFANSLAVGASIGVAASQTFGQAMVFRILQDFGGSSAWSLGIAAIGDIFFRHEKGAKIGITSIAIVTSPFVGGIIGGTLIQYTSWRWTQWFATITIGVGVVLQVFFVPETIFRRDLKRPYDQAPIGTGDLTSWQIAQRRLGFVFPPRDENSHGFFLIATRPFVMLTYAPIALASLWFGATYMLHVGITALIPLVFKPAPFHFSSFDAFSGLIAGLIGEVCAGPVNDLIVKRNAKKILEWCPERRLQANWTAVVLAPIGLILFGVFVDQKHHYVHSWGPPLLGQIFYIWGIEVATTVLQTYILECYPAQGTESTLVFNCFRNLLSFTTPFWITKLIAEVSSSWAFSIFAIVIVALLPFTIGVLMKYGEQIREKQGVPNWNRT